MLTDIRSYLRLIIVINKIKSPCFLFENIFNSNRKGRLVTYNLCSCLHSWVQSTGWVCSWLHGFAKSNDVLFNTIEMSFILGTLNLSKTILSRCFSSMNSSLIFFTSTIRSSIVLSSSIENGPWKHKYNGSYKITDMTMVKRKLLISFAVRFIAFEWYIN